MRMIVLAYDREVILEVGDTVDECGQFLVAVLVDGKKRYAARFTDKRDSTDVQLGLDRRTG